MINWNFPYTSRRMPILAENVVASSQPLACQAGLKMLHNGGNAVDAAIATAITLTVVEPVNNGIGSDAFAIIWDGKNIIGLNASGKSPSLLKPELFQGLKKMPLLGWETVTVPGAVSAWVELWKRYGQLSFKELFEPAIQYAQKGFLVSPITAELWAIMAKMYNKKKFQDFHAAFLPNKKPPRSGQLFKLPEQAETLQSIANSEGEEFYSGKIAKKIADHAQNTGGYLTLKDLEEHRVSWENPLSIDFEGVTIHEMPPNGQGLVTLIALGILKEFDINKLSPDSSESIHLQIEAIKIAFQDAYRHISDLKYMKIKPSEFLTSHYLKKQASRISLENAHNLSHDFPSSGDTVYLTTADSEGMMVSYIQSNFIGFGSGIVIPKTGISLQNRGSGFTLSQDHPNQVGPNKRSYHTIIPGFITKNKEPIMSFGLMGGPMQPQGHVQLIVRIFSHNQNPQTALDAPRWKVIRDLNINLEKCFSNEVYNQLENRGHKVHQGPYQEFGGGQIIYKLEDGYLSASEPRKDGQAVGF